MKNMKVKTKLMVSFLVVLGLAILVGGIGIFGMYTINAADDAMYEGNYLPTVLADEISQNIVEFRLFMRNFIIYDVNDDAESFQKTVTDVAATKAEMEGLFAEYDGTIVNSEDRAAFDEFVRVYRGEWIPLVDTVHDFGAANQTEDAKEALKRGSAIAENMDSLSSKLQEVNLADGKESVDGNTTLFNTMTWMEAVALLVAVAVALFFAFYISGLISTPLTALTAFMSKAGEYGDIALEKRDMEVIEGLSQAKDEVGQSIKSTAKFLQHLHALAEELSLIAGGDLTTQVETLSEKDVMGVAMQKMVNNLNGMFGEINASTSQVSTGCKQIADGAQSLAQGSTEQASAVEQLSSSISEIAAKTKENAQMALRASSLANTIKDNAEKGSSQMDQMMEAVKEINLASQSINKVIKVIDDIAFQTNILALNAAVEAARAGQHGKGFAVVAEEVRNLAAKSAEAAKDTGGLIANSMEKAELGARIAGETAASLTEIVSGINESSRIVGEIAKSSEEQSEGISQINKGIDQVAQVVQQNSATAEESAAASEEMSGQSEMLEQLIAQFKLKNSGIHNREISSGSNPGRKKLIMPEKRSYQPDGVEYGKY